MVAWCLVVGLAVCVVERRFAHVFCLMILVFTYRMGFDVFFWSLLWLLDGGLPMLLAFA